MADPTDAEVIMAKALAEMAGVIAAETGSDQPICTNWVLVAEWSTLDGEQWVTRAWDERKPVWQRDGLLHQALGGPWGEQRE